MPELIGVTPGSQEWLAARRAGVTATDIVTILGLSSYDSVYSLFWRKLGQVPEAEDSDRFRLGRELEPYVVSRWAEDRGSHLPMGGGLYRHAGRPWQMATLDRIMCPAQWDDGHLCSACTPLEVKSWADADRHSWADGPPAAVRAQVLWQMDVMDVAVGHVGAVFLPSGEFRSYVIEHTSKEAQHLGMNCGACEDISFMRLAGEEFMGRLRLELPPPDPGSSAATLAAVRARFARQPAKQAEIDRAVFDSWREAKAGAEDLAEIARGLEIQLREQAGEAAEYTVGGELVARRVISDAQVKAHTRHQDYIRRVKQGDDE